MPAIPIIYQIFFLWIEPFSTVVGAYYAWFQPVTYLELTHAISAPSILGLPIGTNVALRQLANLYLAFALNEGLVLRATSDLKVWRALLLGLLIADFGHLYSCFPLGVSYYYDVAKWNSIAWGNIAFVYCGATLRTCFLLGIGLGGPTKAKKKTQKAIKSVNENVGAVTPSQSNKSPAQNTRRKKAKSNA